MSAAEDWPRVLEPGSAEAVAAVQLARSGGSDGSGRSGGSEGVVAVTSGTTLGAQDGAALLDDVREWLGRFITVMHAGDLDLLTLWAAHTHLAPALYTTPRLQIDSAVPESGKTTVLEHLERLTYRPVLASSISSPALLARLVGNDPRTLLLDEVDRTLDPKKEGVGELVAILNSGYKVGATRPTLMPVKGGGWEPAELSTFAPVAMAGNQPALPDDTRTRIVRVLLLPDWQGQAAESDWETIDDPARVLGGRLAAWAEQVRERVAYRPEMPPGVTGRFREKWQPLARVAHAAGGRWPQAAAALAAADVAQVREDREAGLVRQRPHVVLLRHVHEVWPIGQEFSRTGDLVEALIASHPDVWGQESAYGKDLTAQRLGRMLVDHYGIRTGQADPADKNSPRGYRRVQFGAAERALTRSVGSSGAPVEPPEPPEPPRPPEPATCIACGGRLPKDARLVFDGCHVTCVPEAGGEVATHPGGAA